MSDISRDIDNAIFRLELPDWAFDAAYQQVAVCEKFAGMFLMIAIFWNITSTVIKSKAMKPFDPQKLIRVATIMFILSFYPILAKFVFNTIDLMAQMSCPKTLGDVVGSVWDKLTDAKMTVEKDANEIAQQGGWATFKDWVSEAGDRIALAWKAVYFGAMAGASKVLTGVVKFIVIYLTQFLIFIFFIMGPYALLFSMLPTFENKLEQWFKTYFTMCFIPVTLNLVDFVFNSLVEHYIFRDGYANIVGAQFGMIGYGLVMIIVYTLPFWITGKIVGSESAGKFLSQTVQMATAAAGAMMGKIPGAGSLGKLMGGSGGADNITDASKDAMSMKK